MVVYAVLVFVILVVCIGYTTTLILISQREGD